MDTTRTESSGVIVKEQLLNYPIEPDVETLLGILKREKVPKRVHHIELFLDPEVKNLVNQRFSLDEGIDHHDPDYGLNLEIKIHRYLGYDVFRVPVIRKDFFAIADLRAQDTAGQDLSRGERAWIEEHRGPIQSWDDFERYPWPSVNQINLKALEWMERHLPENMGCYDLTAHILEIVTFLLGYETLCYKIFDDPLLIDALCEKIGTFYTRYTDILCDFDCVPLIWGSDDMGFRTSTMVSPEFLRQKILPWHKACAKIAHDHGKPYLLHACGNLKEVMDDLINAVGIDGKHSYEDSILPVSEAFKLYGERISVLGGIDLDFLCRSGEAEIRKRVRNTLDLCLQGTGYCLGTGNTVANYIPLDSYLVMLDEGRRYTV